MYNFPTNTSGAVWWLEAQNEDFQENFALDLSENNVTIVVNQSISLTTSLSPRTREPVSLNRSCNHPKINCGFN